MTEKKTEGTILFTCGLMGSLAVILGAFSAHGLEDLLVETGLDSEKIARRLAQFETGVRYHLAHAIAMLGLAAVPFGAARAKLVAFRLLLLGCVLFSGSLYLLVLLDLPILGAITPLGGLSWILGWVWIAIIGRNTEKNT